MKRKFNGLIAFILLISLGWVFGWNYFSAKAEAQLDKALARINLESEHIRCNNRRMSGFPFRLVVSCDETRFQNLNAFSVNVAGLHAQAFVYRPFHQVIDFKSPALIDTGALGTLEVSFDQARLGSETQPKGIKAATIKLEGVGARFLNVPAEITRAALHAQSVLVSTRRTRESEPDDGLALAINAQEIKVDGLQYRLPSFNLEAAILAHDVAPVLSGFSKPFHLWIQKGGEADIQGVRIASGESEIFVKGWMKLDLDGLLSADLDVDSVKLESFIDALGSQLDQFQAVANTVIGAIDALASDATLNGKDAKRVKIEIRRGFVKVGFIPVGRLRPLDLSRFR